MAASISIGINEGAADVRFVLDRLLQLNAGDTKSFLLAGMLMRSVLPQWAIRQARSSQPGAAGRASKGLRGFGRWNGSYQRFSH